jgi:pimeloyl-ACP methyl ester carboxylesterase
VPDITTATKQGVTLLLAPSLGRGADDFWAVAEKLRMFGYAVLAPEPFGIRATQNLADATLETLSRHLLDAVPQDGSAVVVVGHAFGNWVARMAAVLCPERVAAVVLLAAAQRTIPADMKPSIDGSHDDALSESERLEHLQRAFFAPGNDARVWLAGWYPSLVAGQRTAAARSDRARWWHAGGVVPILDVHAAQDAIAPAANAMELSAELGARVTTVTIDNAGHALLPEQPQQVAEAIHAFVRRLQIQESIR